MPFLCSPLSSLKSSPDGLEIAPVRCKKWDCPHCHQINRRRVIAIAMASKPKAMLTLTVSAKMHPTPTDAATALKEGLRLLRLRLKRHPRLSNFEFMAVFEKHKSGYPHLHLLIKGDYLPWKWLRRVWEEITGSYHVDIRKISNRGMAAFYVAKYIGKDLTAFEGCKRWWRSHGFSKEASDEYAPDYVKADFSRFDVSFNHLLIFAAYRGWTSTKTQGERVTLHPPPEEWLSLFELLRAAGQAQGATGSEQRFGKAL